MKKALAVLMMVVLSLAVFASGSAESASSTELMLGMVTDSGTIDDRSFNQGTYEGVKKAADELGLACTYLRPAGTTTTDYLTAISDLYDQGYRFIACPGYLYTDSLHALVTSLQKLLLRLRKCIQILCSSSSMMHLHLVLDLIQ